MVETGPNWSAYLGGVAAFAGTLFALVLAARQIRGPLVEDPHPRVSRAYLIDSIAVTVELGAAASFAVLYEIKESTLFSWAAAVLALFGLALAVAAAATYFRAHGYHTGSVKPGAVLQGVGNVLPLSCYVVILLYALGILHFSGQVASGFDDGTWGYAAAVSWLCFSGTVQAIGWYARIWETAKPSSSATGPGAP